MSESQESMALGGSDPSQSEDLLSAFLDAGDLDGLGLDEPKAEDAQEAQEAAAEDVEDEADEQETEAKADDADGADDDGEFIEFETDDGETERVSVAEALQAYNEMKQLGPDSARIRSQITEQAAQQVQERVTKADGLIRQAAEAYSLVQQLVPHVQDPDPVLLDENSPYYNPALYRQQQQASAQVKQMVEEAKAELEKTVNERNAESQQQRQLDMNKEWTLLLDADPTWGKGDAAKRLTNLRSGVCEAYNLPADYVSGVYHNGFIRMAQDALAFRQAQAKPLQAKPKEPPRLVRNGNKRKAAESTASARRKAAAKQVARTGKVTDLEGFYGEFL